MHIRQGPYQLLIFYLLLLHQAVAQPINRKQLVERHKVVNTRYDSTASLSVGNGRFAFTVDITGLQSFPGAYANGVPLGTQSEWGWHSFPDTAGYDVSETLRYYPFNGRNVPYSVQLKEPERKVNAVNWFRQNPHRLQLGNIGLEIQLKDGRMAGLEDVHDTRQTLDPWTGAIHSHFTIERLPVEVTTYAHQQQDAVAFKIISPLLKENRLHIRLRFPYPNGQFKDVGNGWDNDQAHRSTFRNTEDGGILSRVINATHYALQLAWQGKATVVRKQAHYFLIQPVAAGSFELSCLFTEGSRPQRAVGFDQTAANSRQQWMQFWKSGGAVDFSGTADPRAFELERRIILSQYLTRIQCAGKYPPQETGLTYNSWYGKPHLEMHWWHAVHFAQWGRIALLEKSLSWYAKVQGEAKKIAERQGYAGVRWQKMTDPAGKEGPSSVGAFLIWQQPHFIYFSELAYREHNDRKTLERYKDLVFATADFMASYAHYDPVAKKYTLGKGVIPAQERFKAEETFNPTYELVYWHWALSTAQQWKARLHLPRDKKWDEVLSKLSPLPVQDGKYLFTESGTDSYTNPVYRTDHPSVFGAWGMLPATTMMDKGHMLNTFRWIWDNWSWEDTWGWDFPMTAMTATRLGLPAKAIDALLMPVQKNLYLPNGHNFQDKRLTIYLPGNGGLLSAIAMMCAGYDGSKISSPGIPPGWKVKWEGLRKMP